MGASVGAEGRGRGLGDLGSALAGEFAAAFLELAPWLIVGALAAGLLQVFVSRRWLVQQTRGRWGVLRSVLLGIPMPLCSCAVIPAGLGLRRHGASEGSTLGFLVATPQTGVDSVVVTASFLGWPFAVFKLFAALVTGLVAGVGNDIWSAGHGPRTPDDSDVGHDDPHAATQAGPPWRRVLVEAVEVLRSLWHWVVVGLVISAAISVWMPRMALADLSAGQTLLSVAVALVIAVPLYVCATASVPVAASLVAAGLPLGGALVFLMAGPATNMATIAAVRRALGLRSLIVYLVTIVVGSIGFAWLFEVGLGSPGLALEAPTTHHEHGATTDFVGLLASGLLALCFAYFGYDDLRAWLRRRWQAWAKRGQPQLDVRVLGMTCGGCARKVEAALTGRASVRAYEVDAAQDRVRIWGSLSRAELAATVSALGYRMP